MSPSRLILAAALGLALNAHAQTTPAFSTSGTLVVVPAFGEVKHANDEATVLFSVEEQDKDRAAATARVNQKMKQGTDIVRRADPSAELKTVNYYSYPVYPEVADTPRPLASGTGTVRRIPIGWRVGQSLEAKTRNLAQLPKTAAAAQSVLGITGIDYHLSPAMTRKLDDERIAATYRNLNERIASIARAMGRKLEDAVIDTVDFEGSGNYAGERAAAAPMSMMRAKQAESDAMPEPSFEPGETTLQMQAVGKVKFR
jgi:predicted secreted protein